MIGRGPEVWSGQVQPIRPPSRSGTVDPDVLDDLLSAALNDCGGKGMASISLEVSGQVEVSTPIDGNNCLGIRLCKNCGDNDAYPYARDQIYLHGEIKDLRAFAEKILEAVKEPGLPIIPVVLECDDRLVTGL